MLFCQKKISIEGTMCCGFVQKKKFVAGERPSTRTNFQPQEGNIDIIVSKVHVDQFPIGNMDRLDAMLIGVNVVPS